MRIINSRPTSPSSGLAVPGPGTASTSDDIRTLAAAARLVWKDEARTTG
jgi:hypothetical protein